MVVTLTVWTSPWERGSFVPQDGDSACHPLPVRLPPAMSDHLGPRGLRNRLVRAMCLSWRGGIEALGTEHRIEEGAGGEASHCGDTRLG